MGRVVILGAGLTGLSTAYHLERLGTDYSVYEKEPRVGGLCRSEVIQGFTFDYAGHLLHFRDEYARDLVLRLLGENLVKKERNSSIYSKGVYSRYPFQSNLYGLPLSTKLDCLIGLARAKARKPEGESQDFEAWVYSNFGAGIARHFLIPYNSKLWRTNLNQITPDWTGRFVPQVTLREALRGAFRGRGGEKGYNVLFYYPKAGGIEALPLSLASGLKGINLGREAFRIDWKRRRLEFADGSKEEYAVLVTSIPLPELVRILDEAPRWLYEKGRLLRWVGVIEVNLGIERPRISDKHWLYVPEAEFVFYRVGFPMNFSASVVPAGKGSIYAEVSYREQVADTEELVARVIQDLYEMGVLSRTDKVCLAKALDLKYAYVLYDHNYGEARGELLSWLESQHIYSIGRFGGWKYSTMEDAILEGKEIAEQVRLTPGGLGKRHF